MNSTLNPSQPRQMDRFNDRNNEISNSTPHLNVSEFIDSYRDNLGTRLTRACTNLRGASRPDEIFRRDYYRIKDNVNEWAATVFNPPLAMKFIEKYDETCGEIMQCKTGLALNYGDQFMLSDLNSLMDKLNAVKRRAVAAIEQHPTIADNEIEQADLHVCESSRVDLPENRSINLDNVFTDDPEGIVNYQQRTLPDQVPRGDPDPNSSLSTVVAFRSGNRIVDTGPTYARQYQEPERSKDGIDDDSVCSFTKQIVQEIKQTLGGHASRIDEIESEARRFKAKTNQKIRSIQVWIEDIREKSVPEVPPEIISSLQEVINDSAPRIAVESMRGEMRDLRRNIISDQHMTEELQTLVIDLNDQMQENSRILPYLGNNTLTNNVERNKTDSRECEIVRKGIKRFQKQLVQVIKNEMIEEPLDISLVKKCKIVDIPALHTTVAHLQKALQSYVKFPGTDPEYIDFIEDLMDRAGNWCVKIEELYNKAEIHSINSSKGDTNDVGIFSDNAKVTIYEFFNSAEIAYMGRGNSVQRAYRLYNRHLSGNETMVDLTVRRTF